MPKNSIMKLLQTTNVEKERIRIFYNVNEAKIQANIQLLQEWKSKQPHLPQDLTDDFIERIFLRNKFRIEQTKQKIENYFTIRGNNLDLITGLEKIQPTKETTTFVPMPKLTSNLERIIVTNMINHDPDNYNVFDVVKLNLAIGDLALRHDYTVGVRFIADFAGFTMGHLSKMNPVPLAKHITLFQKAYSSRILGVEMINFPSFASTIMTFMKTIMKPKIYNKITIHEHLSSLHKVIAKEDLPFEYGGTQGSINELLVKWDEVMKEHHNFFLQNSKNVSNEALRVGQPKNNDDFGIEGTFRTLAVD